MVTYPYLSYHILIILELGRGRGFANPKISWPQALPQVDEFGGYPQKVTTD